MKEPKLVDSSVWIAYLFNGLHKDIIDSENVLMVSSLSIFEIKKKLIRSDIEKNKVERSIEFIKKRSLVIDVTPEISEMAINLSIENKLPMVDSIIYASAIANNAVLLTLDNDFRNLKGVVIP